MNVLFISEANTAHVWKKYLMIEIPELNFYTWSEDTYSAEQIDYAVAWKPPRGELSKLPRLKAILSIGAGVDSLLSDSSLPKHIPIIRLVDHCLTKGMTEYIVFWTLFHHRHMNDYASMMKNQEWKHLTQDDTRNKHIGILGAGKLGVDAALALNFMQFNVATWSRSPKTIEGIMSFHGDDGFSEIIKCSEILICLLPLTNETQGILNYQVFEQMPSSGVLINCARGGHLVDEDLIKAIDSDQLKAATLDVFNDEPLDKNHPFWTHKKIFMTPHIASLTSPESAAKSLAKTIETIEKGDNPENIVDIGRGY